MNNEKLLELANELIGDVVNQKITGVSIDNTNYEDGSKRLSIVIDYAEASGTRFEIKTDDLKNINLEDVSADIIKAGKINIQN